MPDYSIPNWIQPPDTAKNYLAGLQLGAEIQQRSNALQATQQEAAMRTALQQQQITQQAEENKQRLAMQQEYHDQMMSFKQMELNQEAQKIAQLTQFNAQKLAMEQQVNRARIAQLGSSTTKNIDSSAAMADKALAMQEYQRRVAAGESPSKVMLELGPRMGSSSGYAAAMKATTNPNEVPLTAKRITWEDTGQPIPNLANVGGHVRNVAPEESLQDKTKLTAYYIARKKALETDLKNMPYPKSGDKELVDRWTERTKPIREELAEVEKIIRMANPKMVQWENAVRGITNAPTITPPSGTNVVRTTYGPDGRLRRQK